MHRLITIRISHFNEKARWALDRFGVAYREDAYLPGLHALGVLPLAPRHGLARADANSTPLATPVLITDDGQCIRDSSRIARYVSNRYAPPGKGLYPDREVEQLEASFAQGLGPDTRRVVYHHVFQIPGFVDAIAERNHGRAHVRWFKRIYPVLRPMMARKMDVTAQRAARSLEHIRVEVERVSRRIEGRRYLVGDGFTAADLTFASLLAPVILPEGYGAFLPPVEEWSPEFQAVVREVRASPAGQFALRMFREERGTRVIPATRG